MRKKRNSVRGMLRREVRAFMNEIVEDYAEINEGAAFVDAVIDTVYQIPLAWRKYWTFGDKNDMLNRERILKIHRILDSIKDSIRSAELSEQKRNMYITKFRKAFPDGFNTPFAVLKEEENGNHPANQ